MRKTRNNLYILFKFSEIQFMSFIYVTIGITYKYIAIEHAYVKNYDVDIMWSKTEFKADSFFHKIKIERVSWMRGGCTPLFFLPAKMSMAIPSSQPALGLWGPKST